MGIEQWERFLVNGRRILIEKDEERRFSCPGRDSKQ